MYPTTFLEMWHNAAWHRIGWVATDAKSAADLRAHGNRLAANGGRYRLVHPSVREFGEPEVVHEWPVDASPKPNLGLATTRQLLAELTARIEVDGANGGGGLDYTTVGGRPSAGSVR